MKKPQKCQKNFLPNKKKLLFIVSQYARYRDQMTPEGHRAPLADLLRATTRSVNTQTPATDLPSSSYSSGECRLVTIRIYHAKLKKKPQLVGGILLLCIFIVLIVGACLVGPSRPSIEEFRVTADTRSYGCLSSTQWPVVARLAHLYLSLSLCNFTHWQPKIKDT